MKKTQIRLFSSHSAFRTDKSQLEKINKELRYFLDKKEELDDEFNAFKSDKETTKLHRLALVKKEYNQPVSEKEENAISEIKANYSLFLEEQLEESDPEVETSPEYKERKQLADVAKLINEELATNRSEN
jgi:hypothetical protein